MGLAQGVSAPSGDDEGLMSASSGLVRIVKEQLFDAKTAQIKPNSWLTRDDGAEAGRGTHLVNFEAHLPGQIACVST